MKFVEHPQEMKKLLVNNFIAIKMTFNRNELTYKYLPQQKLKQGNEPNRELAKFAQKDKMKKSNEGNKMSV